MVPEPVKTRFWMIVIASGLLAFHQPSLQAREGHAPDVDNPHLLKTRTTSVSVFKNGLGFFTREGSARTRDGWVMAEQIPPAKFGTLAIYSLNPNEIVDVVGTGPGEIADFDDRDVARDAAAVRRRLIAAKNLKVELSFDEHRTINKATGKLVSVGPSFAILRQGAQSIAVPIERITRIQLLDMPMRIHIDSEEDSKPEKVDVGIAYLSQGITWIPEYTVKILDDETAELTLRGTLVNEAEDLIHCDVNFVVGVPHFQHSQYMAPIAVGQMIRTIGTAVAPTELKTQMMNRAAIVRNSVTADQFEKQVAQQKRGVAQPGDASAALGNVPQLIGPAGTDYTVYTRKDMTVRRGERAIVTLFVQKIRYTHIYRWSVASRMQHFFQLLNDGGSAWTTGPFLAIADGAPLSEDLLKYTPRGGTCEIPVSMAINIANKHSEVESKRKLKAYKVDAHRHWDLVTLDGELKLKNFEKVTASIVIDVPVQGKPISASDDGEVSMDSTNLKLLERTGRVQWSIKLKPDEEKSLTYQYERYIPSH